MSYDANEIVCVVTNADRIDIYQKGSANSGDAYIRWKLALNQSADDSSPSNKGASSDVWRINGIYEYQRTGDTSFSYVRRLCNEGENEIAVRQVGKSDGMGGRAHGDEKKKRAYLFIDGSQVSMVPSGTNVYRCRKVEIIQETDMYEADTQPAAVNVVANCVRRHEWHDGEFYLDNRLEFAVSATLAYGYLAMLTVEREDYQNPDYNITTAAHRAPYWYSENISDSGFGEIEDKSHYIKLSGPNRHGFEVEVIEGWDKPGRSLKVSNAPTYNKVYFDFFGENYTTSIGEILHARTRYRIMRN